MSAASGAGGTEVVQLQGSASRWLLRPEEPSRHASPHDGARNPNSVAGQGVRSLASRSRATGCARSVGPAPMPAAPSPGCRRPPSARARSGRCPGAGLPEEEFGLPLRHHIPGRKADRTHAPALPDDPGLVLGGAQRPPPGRWSAPTITPRKRERHPLPALTLASLITEPGNPGPRHVRKRDQAPSRRAGSRHQLFAPGARQAGRVRPARHPAVRGPSRGKGGPGHTWRTHAARRAAAVVGSPGPGQTCPSMAGGSRWRNSSCAHCPHGPHVRARNRH